MLRRKALSILLAVSLVLSGLAFGFGQTGYGAETIRTTVSNLTITPASVDKGTLVEVDYQIDATYTGTAGGYFRNGQTTEVATDIYDYFTGGTFTEDVHHAITGEVIGKIDYAPGKIIITWNEVAEAYRMTHYTGNFHVDYEFAAKDINTTAAPLVKTVSVGEATADVTWAAKPIYLSRSKTGRGTVSPSSTYEFVDGTYRTTTTFTPADGETLLSVVLYKADGTQENVTVNPAGDTVTVNKAGLPPGYNRLHGVFSDSTGGTTPTPVDPREPTEYEKRTADSGFNFTNYQSGVYKKVGDVIDNKYAPFTMTINHSAFTPLFAAMDDASLFPNGVKHESMNLWDNIPSDASFNFDIPGDGGIYAVLPYYKENRYGYPVPVNGLTQGWYRMVDVTSYFTAVIQGENESTRDFTTRLNNAPKPAYGLANNTTGIDDFRLRLGDTDNGVLKYSDIFPEELANDPVYAQVFGDDNPLNGTIQCYVIKYSDDHSRQTWGGSYENVCELSWKGVESGSTSGAQSRASYTIRGTKSRIQGSGGDFELYYYDEQTGKGIQGGLFALEKKDDASGTYVPYTIGGEQVSGLTADEDGYLMLQNLIPGDYRLVKQNTVAGYENSTTSYRAGPGNNGRNMSGTAFTVASGAAASVVMLVGENRNLQVNVYYDANGGAGSLTDANNPYKPGDVWKALSPAGSISRSGYYFSGWNDKADGTGTTYAVNGSYTMPDTDVTLYAQWAKNNQAELTTPAVKKTLHVVDQAPTTSETFAFALTPKDTNPALPGGLVRANRLQGEGTIPAAFGETITFDAAGEYEFTVKEVPGNTAGYTYDDTEHTWKVKVVAGAYNYEIVENTIDGTPVVDGGTFEFTNTYTEAAPPTYCTITYKLNGGEYAGSTEDIKVTAVVGENHVIHEAPTRQGHKFLYWKGSEYQPGDNFPVPGDHTFVAQWAPVSSDDPSDTPTNQGGDKPQSGQKAGKVTVHKSAATDDKGVVTGAWGLGLTSLMLVCMAGKKRRRG